MTITTATTAAEKEALAAAYAVASEATDCAAVLPYWPVWAAAQFASDDAAKQLLNFVHVWRDGDALQVEATDGHRAFRYRMPAVTADGMETLWRLPEGGHLLLWAKPLKKAVAHASLLTVTRDLRAVFHGGKKGALAELSAVNVSGFFSVHQVEDSTKVGRYPQINQLWPDKFSNQPNGRFGFNARYLREWCAVVEKLSDNSVTSCVCNAAVTPFVWRANYEPRVGQHFSDAQLELLLMPVQIRDWGKG